MWMRGVGTWVLLLKKRTLIDGFYCKLSRFWDEGGVCRHDEEVQARLGDVCRWGQLHDWIPEPIAFQTMQVVERSEIE